MSRKVHDGGSTPALDLSHQHSGHIATPECDRMLSIKTLEREKFQIDGSVEFVASEATESFAITVYDPETFTGSSRHQPESIDTYTSPSTTGSVAAIDRLPQDVAYIIFWKTLDIAGINWIEEYDPLKRLMERRMNLQLVSRNWNALILSRPSFWSIVDVLSPHAGIDITRSRESPLAVMHRRRGTWPPNSCNTESLLRTQGHRVQTLRVSSAHIARSLSPISLQKLETLDIRLSLSNPEQFRWPGFISGPFPALKTLVLISSALPPDPEPFRAVKIVHIEFEGFTVLGLLRFLASLIDLEELSIRVSQGPAFPIVDNTSDIPQVQFVNLRRMELGRIPSSSLITVLTGVRHSQVKHIAINMELCDLHLGRTVEQCLEALQVPVWGSSHPVALTSADSVTCIADDGRTLKIFQDTDTNAGSTMFVQHFKNYPPAEGPDHIVSSTTL